MIGRVEVSDCEMTDAVGAVEEVVLEVLYRLIEASIRALETAAA